MREGLIFCDEVTAGCIVMRWIAAPVCGGMDVEMLFGLRDLVLSEVFWESDE